jgi:hypothetical protein
LYNASQAAARIGVTRQRFSQWVQAGRVVADTTINGRGRYTEATVETLMLSVRPSLKVQDNDAKKGWRGYSRETIIKEIARRKRTERGEAK